MHRLKFALFFMSFVLVFDASAAVDTAPFKLVKEGDQVCKIEPKGAKTCYPAMPLRGSTEPLDILASIKQFEVDSKELNGSIFLSKANRVAALAHLRHLDIRNIAFDAEKAVKVPGGTVIPFYASLRWISKASGINGTVHFAGTFTMPEDLNSLGGDEKDEALAAAKANQTIAKLLEVKALTDSYTEQNWPMLRNLEYAGRAVSVKWVYGWKAGVDEKTIAVAQQIAAPFVFGEVVIGVSKSVAEGIGRALGDALVQMFTFGPK
jgi:hypothetical protein